MTMAELLGIPLPLIFGQLLIGLINGSFYALLSLGLAVIFGLLNVINFAHGAFYMLGAVVAWFLLNTFGIGYFPALILAPLVVGIFGVILEKTLLSRLYQIDHLYGLLLTFGVALILEGLFINLLGVSGNPYGTPQIFTGGFSLGFMFLPTYRAWVIIASLVVCFGTWIAIERTKLGSYLRAAVENPQLVRAFGIRVPLMMTLTYGFAAALAGLAGVLAAPIYTVSPIMGQSAIITVFAIVVIGGMGSILGSILTGLGVGLLEGLTRLVYPEASSVVVFLLMIGILVVRPHGLFGRA